MMKTATPSSVRHRRGGGALRADIPPTRGQAAGEHYLLRSKGEGRAVARVIYVLYDGHRRRFTGGFAVYLAEGEP